MFVLAKFVEEQSNFFGDVLDKRPSKLYKPNPLLLVIDDKLPLSGKITALLKSELAAQVCWALNNIPRLVKSGEECTDIIHKIPQFMKGGSSRIELAAVNTAIELLRQSPSQYAKIFWTTVLTRIKSVPAIEYGLCVEQMCKAVTSNDINKDLVPLIEQLFKQSDVFQHIASAMLCMLPIDKANIDKEMFGRFLDSPIFVNEYLVRAADIFVKKFGNEWLEKDLPEHLVKKKSDANKPGVALFFVAKNARIRLPSLYTELKEIYDWGAADPKIAMICLNECEAIANSRFVDLSGKMYQLLNVVVNDENADVRKKLPGIMCEKPILLVKTPESILKGVLEKLARDKDPKVKCEFLDKVSEMHKKIETPKGQALLVSLFLELLKERAPNTREALINKHMLVALSKANVSGLMQYVLDLMNAVKDRWRCFTRLLSILEEFPTKILADSLKKIMIMVDNGVRINPQALSRSAISFYAFIIHSKFQTIRMNELMKYLTISYAQCEHFQLRILYLKIATALLNELEPEFYFEQVFSVVAEYKTEKVVFVKAALLDYLTQFVKKYNSEKRRFGAQIDAILKNIERDKDPFIVEKLKSTRDSIGVIPMPKVRSESNASLAAKPLIPPASPIIGTRQPMVAVRPRPPTAVVHSHSSSTLKRRSVH